MGLLTIVLSLLSAIDSFSANLFLMHMIQHLLLIMVAAPLIMVANPFPILLWGLPRGRDVGLALFSPGARFAQLLRTTNRAGITWLLFVACLWGWHDPGVYDAALKSDLVHDIEHLTFYVTALLFWWHVTQSGPRVHRSLSPAARIAYTVSIVPANMVAGVAISFASEPLYRHYLTVPRLWGLTALEDQQLGGTIMWIPGSMMYLVAAIILDRRVDAGAGGADCERIGGEQAGFTKDGFGRRAAIRLGYGNPDYGAANCAGAFRGEQAGAGTWRRYGPVGG